MNSTQNNIKCYVKDSRTKVEGILWLTVSCWMLSSAYSRPSAQINREEIWNVGCSFAVHWTLSHITGGGEMTASVLSSSTRSGTADGTPSQLLLRCLRIIHLQSPSQALQLLWKEHPYSLYQRWIRSWSRCTGSQPAGDVSNPPAVGCHHFPAKEHHRPTAGTKLYCL